jgi:hypothetical protein
LTKHRLKAAVVVAAAEWVAAAWVELVPAGLVSAAVELDLPIWVAVSVHR